MATTIRKYDETVAEQIIEAIKAGTAPWMKPWKAGAQMLPHNLKSGKAYRGGNSIWLATVAMMKGYADPRWGTFRQIKAAGGFVRKGERGSRIVFWSFDRKVKTDKVDANGKPVYERQRRDFPLCRVYTVFNAEQADKLPAYEVPEDVTSEWERHDRAEKLAKATGVPIQHVAGDRACYNRATDQVTLPLREQFPHADAYYGTAFHEIGHASGHPTRLDRDTLNKSGAFGSETYAREELRAEIAALMIGEALGIGYQPRETAAYCDHWVSVLQKDPSEIRRAAQDAQKITDWILAHEK